MDRGFLGIDLGTSSVKAAVVDHDGVTVGRGRVPLDLLVPEPQAAEQDAGAWWDAATAAIAEALDDAGHPRIEALGLTGQKHALLVLDQDEVPLGPAWLWADGRAAREARALDALPGYLAPKWRLWRALHADRLPRARHLCFAKDWLRLRLAGVLATEGTEASTIAAYDSSRRLFDPDRCRALGIPPELLPPVVASTAATGGLQRPVAGLEAGTPVVGGAGDNEAAALACGIVEEGIVGIVLGTSGTVVAPVPRRPVPPGLVLGDHAVSTTALATGVVMAAGRSLVWVRDLAFEAGTSIESVVEAAQAVPEDARLPLFLPSLAGERSPVPDPRARGAFVGLGPEMRAPHLARAVLEGVALALGQTVDLVRRAGVEVREVRLTSKGAVSGLWRRLIAAATGVEVLVLGGDEGPARGAAMLAACRGGTDAELLACARAWTADAPREQPEPATVERLRRRSEELRGLRAALGHGETQH